MTIDEAIKNLRLVRFSYDSYSRTVEPHTYGRDKKGELMLRAYQVAGGSKSGEVGWKVFCVSDMRGTTVLEETFSGPRPKYKRGDTAFTSIIAQL